MQEKGDIGEGRGLRRRGGIGGMVKENGRVGRKARLNEGWNGYKAVRRNVKKEAAKKGTKRTGGSGKK